MNGYLPHTDDDIRAMLDVIGVGSVDALFQQVPERFRAQAHIDLPPGCSEVELDRKSVV